MGEYSKFISPKRRSIPTPKDMVVDGKCVFGTFDTEFETMDMLHIDGPTAAPNEMNHIKFSCWEATEVHFKEGLLLTAFADMGIYGAILTIWYDKRTRKVTTWNIRLPREAISLPDSLINTVARAEGPAGFVSYRNNFQDGKAQLEAKLNTEDGNLEFNLELRRLSKPSIVCIPFEDPAIRHRPMYSQKDLFKVDGSLTLNGETITTDETTTGIIDDHKGYYPEDAHYDWLTTMGVHDADGEAKWFAFNLTRNQSIDQGAYNENLIWLENETSLLPPITFKRSIPTMDFEDYALWEVKDEHGMVDIRFHVYGVSKLIAKMPPVLDMEYFVVFGELEGYILDENGKKYVLDGMAAMGEDKSLSIHV